MPRRSVTRCTRRSSPADELEDTVEWNLLVGECFGFADLATRHEFMRPWSTWRQAITARWREALPGSRPMACYLAGEIPAPSWVNDVPALRRPLRPIAGVALELVDTSWHRDYAELDHLVDLGLVDDDELELAEARLAGPDPTSLRRYRSLAGTRPVDNFIEMVVV